MTMHLSVISARERTFRWVSAGHDAALIYSAKEDKFQEIDGSEMPLGISEDTDYIEYTFAGLEPGHIVVIGTDGVWEMPNTAGELFGKDKLMDVIRACACEPAEKIAAEITRSLDDFGRDCRRVDDVTFVVIKVPANP
jgi:sigma-B regulation protein RsbU (phosphoserine phosphatase)